jgi:Flp pilus assembly protein TadG
MTLTTLRRKIIRNRRGQALVELALVVPVLLALVFGIVEFGRLFSAYMTIQHAAREGARLGVLGATDAEIASRVYANSPTLDPALLSVTVSPGITLRTPGSIMTVSVAYSFQVVIPIVNTLLGSTVPVAAFVSMRVE